ncbi:DUF3540 domain-containing protein [Bradyrhizobium sp. UFLA05-112]
MTVAFRSANADLLATTERLLEPGHHTARVVAVDENGVASEVEVAGTRHPATVAFGCLVRPITQDLVLVFSDAGRVFVLAVLERRTSSCGTIALPSGGNISIEGNTIAIAGRQRMSLRADTIDLQTELFAVLADKATWVGRLFSLIADRFRSVTHIQETSAHTLTVKAVERIAIIDRIDSLQTETQAIKVAGIASETAHSKVIAVTEDLRLDGKRVTVA